MIKLSHKTSPEFTAYVNMRIKNAYNAFLEANGAEPAEDGNISGGSMNYHAHLSQMDMVSDARKTGTGV